MPVAINCWVAPTGTLGSAGVTDMAERVAVFTVRVVLPEDPEAEKLLAMVEVAVIIVVPAAMPVAKPLLLTVATNVFDELHATSMVILRVVWSLK